MRPLFFLLFLVSFFASAQDLKAIRVQYPKAVESSEITSKLNENLSSINTSNDPVLQAYKGAIFTLKAKFAKSKSDKKTFFKEGVSLIEAAANTEPSNIEIRYIRMSVQENSPKFLGYHKNIETDKQFILEHYSKVSSKELKALIRDFAQKSKSFETAEIELFK